MAELRRTILLIAYACLMSIPVAAHDDEKPLSIKVSWKANASRSVLEFEISNRSDEAIILGESSLPWKDRHSIVIIGATKSKGALASTYPIRDRFFERQVAIKPGEVLKGNVNLEHFISHFTQALSQSEILIFWSYEPKTHQGVALGHYGGQLSTGQRM